MRKILFLIVFAVIYILLLFSNISCSNPSAPEPEPEPVEEYDSTMVWYKADSPIVIDSCFTVPRRTILEIEPGVEVLFKASENEDDFDYNNLNVGMMKVDGKLLAVGTETDSIIFTRNGDVGNWGMIFFNDSLATNHMKYCRVDEGYQINNLLEDNSYPTDGALLFYNAKGTIESSSIIRNKHKGIFLFKWFFP